MKNSSLLVLLIIASLLFAVGLAIHGSGRFLHVAFIVVAMICGFTFYLLSFRKAIKTKSLTKGRRMFWIIAIVCLPMIGNTFFVIIDEASNKPQVSRSLT